MMLPQAIAWVQYWFRVLSLNFCGKSKKICGDISPQSPAFCMYGLIWLIRLILMADMTDVVDFADRADMADMEWAIWLMWLMWQKNTYNQILHPKHSEQNTCQWYWSGIACDLVLYPPPITAFLLYLSNFVHVRIPGAPNWQGWTYARSARRKYAPPRCNYSRGFNYRGPQVPRCSKAVTRSPIRPRIQS